MRPSAVTATGSVNTSPAPLRGRPSRRMPLSGSHAAQRADRRVSARRRDAVGSVSSRKLERREDGGRRDADTDGAATFAARFADPAIEPAVHQLAEARVAQAQVVVGDAAAAGEQVEGERQRRQVEVAARASRSSAGSRAPPRWNVSTTGLRSSSYSLSARSRSGYGRDTGERVGQRDGVLHRQLGARADGEVRGVRRVAEQHDVLA